MAKVDKYAPIVASKQGGPVYLKVGDVQLFHKNTETFCIVVEKLPNGFILSTRAERGDRPEVHLHAVPCHIWQRGPDPTIRYVKGLSKSILPLFQYAQQVYPNRLVVRF